MHATEHLLRPLDALLPSVAAGPPQVYLTPAAMAAAGRFWEGVGLPGAGVIALHPGSGGRYKLWPLAGWQRLMRWVAEQGLPCVMISGPAEQEHIAWLLQETSLPTWPCATQLQLPHLAALLARCRLVVSHDSGIAHLAAAVGATTLALFGPTDPLIWGPRSRRACVLHPRVAGPLTLDNLPVERVLEVLAALYQGEWMFTPSTIDCTLVPVPPI
jgi:heptosyltransferase-2